MSEENVPFNFGCLPPLPDGYSVEYVISLEHYMAFGPDGWESMITCWPHDARRWCFQHAAEKS